MNVNTPRDGDMVILKGFNRRMAVLAIVTADHTVYGKPAASCFWYDEQGRAQMVAIPLDMLEVATLN